MKVNVPGSEYVNVPANNISSCCTSSRQAVNELYSASRPKLVTPFPPDFSPLTVIYITKQIILAYMRLTIDDAFV
jgi:hypothetical protein